MQQSQIWPNLALGAHQKKQVDLHCFDRYKSVMFRFSYPLDKLSLLDFCDRSHDIYIILFNGQAKPTSFLFNTFSVFSSRVIVEMQRVERGLSGNLDWWWVAIQQRQHSCPQPLSMSDPECNHTVQMFQYVTVSFSMSKC